ncbi:MAG: amino acid ABC transporter ATP-binding protein [Alphaproteobacteria bacterium]|nr:amino acid ABC transporter ATP-binding protein [Alphaproteobacteria bacterium]
MLSARNIYKSFDGRKILDGVDIDIAPGQISCIIGPSGTGKTTLLRALCMLDLPDEGSISLDGTVLGPQDTPWPRVTAVFQSLFLWPHLTLRENIMLPARNHNPDAAKDIEGLINLFEMGHFIDNYPNQSSVGQRQRVALARALILNPKYVLLDEITSALDVEQSARILTKLTHLKERGIGIFLITHHLGFAKRAADQIIFMSDGKVTEKGAPSILETPQTPRLREFLSLAEIAA